jgi:phosphoglycerate dehydrogenase-like enzyme
VQFKPHPQASVLLLEPENHAELKLYRDILSQEFPEMRLLLAGSQEEAQQLAPTATALLCKAHHVKASLLAAMPHLDWIQALTTGVDAILALTLPPAVTLTSARGIHGPQMSELALLQMMSLARDFPRMLHNQQQANWKRWPQRLLLGKTVAIVGIGAVGRELARRCAVFGMRVIGVSDAVTTAEHFNEILPRTQLTDAANRADFMILLVPYSADTRHLVDARILQAMKPGSFLINNARGPVVDEQALLAALKNGPMAGAALDVFNNEPLDPNSPLWLMPNVIITPHIGGLSDCYAEQLMPMLIDNLRSYIAGHAPAHNLVPLR